MEKATEPKEDEQARQFVGRAADPEEPVVSQPRAERSDPIAGRRIRGQPVRRDVVKVVRKQRDKQEQRETDQDNPDDIVEPMRGL